MKKHTNPMTARDVALDILIQYETLDAFSNLLLHQELEKSNLEARDKRLVTELVYGVIQRKNSLDWVIKGLLKKGGKGLELWVHQLLRLGLYQMIYLDKIPERAAVHETVQIAKVRGHKGISGLVNGIMRSYLREHHKRSPLFAPKNQQEEAIVYSHPTWMVQRLHELYGAEQAIAIMKAQNEPPKVSVRLNRMKWDREEFVEMWNEEEQGEASDSEVSLDGVILKQVGNAANHSYYQNGAYTIQDESSMLVGYAVDPKPGMKVLDACAAPGGKTTHLAELMENDGSILAYDIHPHKIELVKQHAERLGISIIETRVRDAREIPLDDEKSKFDVILLDAPCSGLGVIHRKPDIKWSKEAKQIRALTQLQAQLLDHMTHLLKPGGVLVYSTCTWEARENKEQIELFLKRHPEFSADEKLIDSFPDLVRERAIMGNGWVQILPHHFHSDGFFIAKLRKNS